MSTGRFRKVLPMLTDQFEPAQAAMEFRTDAASLAPADLSLPDSCCTPSSASLVRFFGEKPLDRWKHDAWSVDPWHVPSVLNRQ